jgi:hypothetical protein
MNMEIEQRRESGNRDKREGNEPRDDRKRK